MHYIKANSKSLRAIRKRTREAASVEHRRYYGALLGKLAGVHGAQDAFEKDTAALAHVADFVYPCLRDSMELFGGSADLHISEDSLVARITCTGSELSLSGEETADLLSSADDLYLSAEDGLFTLTLLYPIRKKRPSGAPACSAKAILFLLRAAGAPAPSAG